MPNSREIIHREWDGYWQGHARRSNALYSAMAALYRKFIIAKSSHSFLEKHFPQGQAVLHAGCGTGEVDRDLSDRLRITALDISARALEIYRRNHPRNGGVCRADLLHLPHREAAFDGIYNLGVMEHFAEHEILAILGEFRRALKPTGKVVLFWPTIFSPSVHVLDALHFVLNRVLKRNVKLHPDEITRLRSRRQVADLCNRAGLALVEYHFGIRDFFTQARIVAQRPPGNGS